MKIKVLLTLLLMVCTLASCANSVDDRVEYFDGRVDVVLKCDGLGKTTRYRLVVQIHAPGTYRLTFKYRGTLGLDMDNLSELYPTIYPKGIVITRTEREHLKVWELSHLSYPGSIEVGITFENESESHTFYKPSL